MEVGWGPSLIHQHQTITSSHLSLARDSGKRNGAAKDYRSLKAKRMAVVIQS